MLRRSIIVLPALVLTCVALLWMMGLNHVHAGSKPPARGQVRDQSLPKRLGVRLRSFIPGASGSMNFEPTITGGIVRLTALSLPRPQTLMPDARNYVVWAVASGERPIRVGELRVDASGNGGLEFERPASFERYSVLVTAETSTASENPIGVMVLASRAGAVTAFFGEKERRMNESRLRRLNEELRRRARASRLAPSDFFAEVDQALNASAGGGRILELFGDEVTPEAHGLARVTSLNQKAYVRAAVTRLPLPTMVGANTYVLWSVMSDGRIVYMGSLPTTNLNDSDIYVRVGGFNSDDFDLFVTAEMRRPISRPSGRRALSTRSEQDVLARVGAIAGQVVDSAGNPVAGATVSAVPENQTAGGMPPITFTAASTDEGGRFYLEGVTPGTYIIYAAKESAGYPSTSFNFFVADPRSAPKVTVGEQQVAQNVLVRLGPKAARLVGRIVDAKTGQPVDRAEIFLTRADNPNNYHITGPNRPGGDFQLLVPSIAFKIKVSAPGYQDWYFGNDGKKERASVMQIAPNATQELTIALRPK
ncbi:MAG TPA: carboxypeptidase-like regulatory domain-containing protein [Pyrinomonadaceae bacterium]|nr:carboxypeptidase-like regulatory domain-containing protein [Pyrinomonadaceae bacterium]